MEFYFNQLKLKAKILHEINGSYIRKAKPLDRKKITNTKLIIIARKIWHTLTRHWSIDNQETHQGGGGKKQNRKGFNSWLNYITIGHKRTTRQLVDPFFSLVSPLFFGWKRNANKKWFPEYHCVIHMHIQKHVVSQNFFFSFFSFSFSQKLFDSLWYSWANYTFHPLHFIPPSPYFVEFHRDNHVKNRIFLFFRSKNLLHSFQKDMGANSCPCETPEAFASISHASRKITCTAIPQIQSPIHSFTSWLLYLPRIFVFCTNFFPIFFLQRGKCRFSQECPTLICSWVPLLGLKTRL